MKQIWQTVEQFHMLNQGDRVLLGVSGGPDSMALLHLMNGCRERYGVQLFVVHVNHQLRREAAEEAAYVQHICRQWDIPFRLFSADVAAYADEHGMSLEQAGHEVRYACFREAADEWHINKLALGHHRDDRAESLLMHLIQGCGLDGLCAMPPKDKWLNDTDKEHEREIIRPLAQVGKQELMEYCNHHHLQYFVDSTNLEAGCLRNQIRLELLPQLRRYNPQITDAILRLQDNCAADADYLVQTTEALWKQYGAFQDGFVMFPADVLAEQHTALQRRLLRLLYEKLNGTTVNLTYRQMEQMLHIALQSSGSQQIHLADDVVFVRQYDTLLFRKADEANQLELSAEKYVLHCELLSSSADWMNSSPQSNSEVFVDADKLTGKLTVRNRKPGDKLSMPYGHKKLKDFFIDQKVPAERRNTIPIILSDEEIIWIPGYYTAHRVRITDETTRVCRLRCSILD